MTEQPARNDDNCRAFLYPFIHLTHLVPNPISFLFHRIKFKFEFQVKLTRI